MFHRSKEKKNKKKPQRLAKGQGTRIGSDSFNMDDKLQRIFAKPIDATVMKDLPRLAGRIEVIDNTGTDAKPEDDIIEEEDEEPSTSQQPPVRGAGEGYDYFYVWLTREGSLPAERSKKFKYVISSWGTFASRLLV